MTATVDLDAIEQDERDHAEDHRSCGDAEECCHDFEATAALIAEVKALRETVKYFDEIVAENRFYDREG